MSADAYGPSIDSMGNMPAQKPGWLFILPWPLHEIGGVNQVVKGLIRCFRESCECVPHVLVTTRRAAANPIVAPETVDQSVLDVWSPIDARNPTKALLSFVYRFPGRFRALRHMVIRQNIRIVNPHFPNLNALMFIA